MYVGNLVAGLVTEDALRQLFNTTMQARPRADGACGTTAGAPAVHAPALDTQAHAWAPYAEAC